MKLSLYLKDKLIFILSQAGILTFLVFALYVLNINTYFIFLITFTLILGDIAYLVYDFVLRYRYYRRLENNLHQMDKKHLITGFLEKPSFADGEILCDIIRAAAKSMNDEIAVYKISQEEYRDYIEAWIHEVKTPIACIDLICKNDKNEITEKISTESKKIEEFIEQALYYARSTNVSADYSIRKLSLENTVKTAVKKYSKQLIAAKANISFEIDEKLIYADEKWLIFILGQIIGNSIKYKKENFSLLFKAIENPKNIILSIIDNGVGIKECDINRVFQKGFTGENGRIFAKSTGMGLYICKTLCDKMYLGLEISSDENIGTEIKIFFPKEKILG